MPLKQTVAELRCAIVFLTVIAMSGCFGGEHTPTSATDAVISYVERTKRWHRADYSVELLRDDKEGLAFLINHVEDRNNPIPGAGKSFIVVIEPSTNRVVKEYGFQ
jgi:hypothetical protein